MPPSTSSPSTATSVQVALRIRPPTTQDSTSIPARFQRTVIHAASSETVAIEASASATPGPGPSPPTASPSSASAPKKQYFTFDQVHAPQTTQYELFTSTARPLISRFLEGFNCTILAYGQTSSGKTFTMTGIDLDADPSDPHNGMGIIPRAVSHIFSQARQIKEERGGAWTYSIKGSFVELYNEDLIDLLNLEDVSGGKREVQIREDKDGHIIWGGLREITVRNPNEVMTLIRKGTAIRRTNETDMNAQSSRSHAIFSLTLTQKKYTGSGTPPRSSSPNTAAGRSPSRLARPGSVYSSPNGPRVSSPTFGRPPTPSFAAAMGRGGGLRPSSALGYTNDRLHVGDEEGGEWVTIVSKFHFVDLAGSERLKRTAAVGDRIKEGISINSGLLALGNVISALGDPSRAKSNTASYVPYRDSKLTRLLQDSLGGNAHTLMIACVSPAEWNAAETLNTLKYANRARNIKNRAIINEREEGWDDVEWLQATVTRLRKELKSLKETGVVPIADHPMETEGASKKVLAQMTELQNNYEDLREKFVERTEELTRLRRELGVKQRESSGGAIGGTAKYEEIVGPVIEEYEKTISAMEAELSLNRAALRHTNELVEEKEEEFAILTERHAAIELYVEELKARVAKLTERETSTEAYVRDLEEKVKSYDESSLTSNESLSDLKRELSKFKETEAHSMKYIAELEARLTRSDESILELQQTVERYERECERRRDEVEVLQSRLDSLRKDGESWRSDLEVRERKVKELEERLLEWEKRRNDAGEARARLGNVVDEVVSARRSVEIDLAKASAPSSPTEEGSIPSPSHAEAAPTLPSPAEQALESQLAVLQQTHTATLADLASVTAKYRDALREISDLAAQIQEAKLSNTSMVEASSTDSPIGDKAVDFPSLASRRRPTGGRVRDHVESPVGSAGRRLLYRQAASAESLHLRSLSQSQSLSQELSSAHSRKTSFSSHTSSHSPSSSHSYVTIHSAPAARPDLSIVLNHSPIIHSQERSALSLEKEIMRLQEVLKDREAEIAILEKSLKELQNEKSSKPADGADGSKVAPIINGTNGVGCDFSKSETHLSPKTLNRFDNLRSSLINGHESHDDSGREKGIDADESLERLNELMLSMAQKESQHKEVVDGLTTQLTQVRRQLDDLTTLSRNQALNMSAEMEALRGQYEKDLQLLAELQQLEGDLKDQLEKAETVHAAEVEALRKQHEQILIAKTAEVDELIASMKIEHDSSVSLLRVELEASVRSLEEARLQHEESFGKLKADHQEDLTRCVKEVNESLDQTKAEHEKALTRLRTELAEALEKKETESTILLQNTEEEYYNALTKLRGDHAEAINKLTAEFNATTERLREEHAGELRMAEIAREGSLAESQSSLNLALKELQEEHAAAVARKETSFSEEMESFRKGHERLLKAKEDDHTLQVDRLRLEHECTLTKLKDEWRVEVERLKSLLVSEQEQNAAASKIAQKENEALLQQIREQHASAISELERKHDAETTRLAANLREAQEQQSSVMSEYERRLEAEITELKTVHNAALSDGLADFEKRQFILVQNHAEELQALQLQHEQKLAEAQEQGQGKQKELEAALKEVQVQYQRAVAAEKESFDTELEDIKRRHNAEIGALHEERDSLLQELEIQKVAAHEFNLLREEKQQEHDDLLTQKTNVVQTLEQQLSSVTNEKDDLVAEMAKLRAELDRTRSEQSKLIQEASKRQSLTVELERHRSVIADLQESLQKVKDEKDVLQTERQRADNLVKDLQAQAARSASPPNARTTPERNLPYARATGLTALKLPPPTPPPSVPPPPAPRSANHVNADSIMSTSSQSSSNISSSTPSKESQPDTPATSIVHGPTPTVAVDPKIAAKLDQQSKQLDEQEAMIKTLNKQLTHCETDLQAHMDLVSSLEASLGDSEKNLRKARMHATELARERDSLNSQIEMLKQDLADAKREVVSVRRSIVEEKQSLEQRLEEEKKAKEYVRQQLDSRMEELQRRKSKFACL
ncbi:hypothetical protein AMATHDRAFT_135365 [Amanita thiersii Skay4041]|uniref:Kinesin motor domain-containing protein n=1 Tax=Amanita thiersii Skay4041 TaxID=703135 RepID=A0A2A9NTD1_9AGAR|nr:hypothetical protein AMATHDRAFT_135365 [Amanita thiersii Skay4041]